MFDFPAGSALQMDLIFIRVRMRVETEKRPFAARVKKADDRFFFLEFFQHAVNGRSADFFAASDERFVERIDIVSLAGVRGQKIENYGSLFRLIA